MKHKLQFTKEFRFMGKFFNMGFSFRRLALGFTLDEYLFEIDLFFFWFGVEL